MNGTWPAIAGPILFVMAGTLLAPLGIGLALGADRRATAAMQLRIGPPLLQPLYDLTKLFAKTPAPEDRLAAGLLVAHVVLAGSALALVLAGGDLLVAVIVLGAGHVAFILAAAAVESPYAQLGAMREVVLLVAIEPLLVVTVVAYAAVAGSFAAWEVAAAEPLLPALPTLGLTLAVSLAAMLRKSPFDIASSHHGHQELVKGSTTEMAGRWLGLAELGHWYETAFVLALVVLAAGRLALPGLALAAATWAAVVVADNALPRARWRGVLAIAWGAGGGAGLLALASAAIATGRGILP